MIEINIISPKYGIQIVKIDDSIYSVIKNHKISIKANHSNKKHRNNFYATIWLNGKHVSLHRFVMSARKGEIVDHKDCNSLNNQKNNLRKVTRSQNAVNRHHKRKSTSKYYGVNYDKTRNLWECKLKKDQVKIWVGRFKNEEEAALAYNKKAIEIHGQFATLNKIQ
ncbi:hypothetical protein LCGC14_0716420 [marine sediment metagenome]|uniref:AP2/ERF domain-containing protein n=1 Tax=marine sediment metagenome TaxID=412755 RepID=A0A0F9TL41_9ZZZZ